MNFLVQYNLFQRQYTHSNDSVIDLCYICNDIPETLQRTTTIPSSFDKNVFEEGVVSSF